MCERNNIWPRASFLQQNLVLSPTFASIELQLTTWLIVWRRMDYCILWWLHIQYIHFIRVFVEHQIIELSIKSSMTFSQIIHRIYIVVVEHQITFCAFFMPHYDCTLKSDLHTIYPPPPPPLPHPQRTNLLDSTTRLEKTTDRLSEGYRIAQETEEIGLEIMDNLQRDRETIGRMRGRVSLSLLVASFGRVSPLGVQL